VSIGESTGIPTPGIQEDSMMNWLSRLTGNRGSTTTIKISGKEIEIICSANADKALARRDQPLVVEIELAFACFARKRVLFHDTPSGKNVIDVNAKLALQITTIIPDTCEVVADTKMATRATLLNFMPKWVRIDYVKGKWAGEYGL
jgi:hypothetical protein